MKFYFEKIILTFAYFQSDFYNAHFFLLASDDKSNPRFGGALIRWNGLRVQSLILFSFFQFFMGAKNELLYHLKYSRFLSYYGMNIFNSIVWTPFFFLIAIYDGVNRTTYFFSSFSLQHLVEIPIKTTSKTRLKAIIFWYPSLKN